MTHQSTLAVEVTNANQVEHRRRIATALNRAIQGKLNCTGSVTLTANVTTTTMTDEKIGADSWIGFMPTTANAAGALATTYISARAQGSATVTHANAATVDRTFVYAILG